MSHENINVNICYASVDIFFLDILNISFRRNIFSPVIIFAVRITIRATCLHPGILPPWHTSLIKYQYRSWSIILIHQIIYLFKASKRKTRAKSELCPKLNIRTPERYHWHRSSDLIVNFEHVLHDVGKFHLLALNIYFFAG